MNSPLSLTVGKSSKRSLPDASIFPYNLESKLLYSLPPQQLITAMATENVPKAPGT
jgi:hypothetical protein